MANWRQVQTWTTVPEVEANTTVPVTGRASGGANRTLITEHPWPKLQKHIFGKFVKTALKVWYCLTFQRLNKLDFDRIHSWYFPRLQLTVIATGDEYGITCKRRFINFKNDFANRDCCMIILQSEEVRSQSPQVTPKSWTSGMDATILIPLSPAKLQSFR